MNINCKDPSTFIFNSNCRIKPLELYADSYEHYISDMNNYCSQSDNAISNKVCNDFIENNEIIQNTDIQKKLKNNILDMCKNNIKPELNDICSNKYNIKSDLIKQEEDKMNKIIIGIITGISAGILGGLFLYYKKNKKKNTN